MKFILSIEFIILVLFILTCIEVVQEGKSIKKLEKRINKLEKDIKGLEGRFIDS